jgi:tripartite-type tricarboxylate transporter receptor subunit TctC
MRSGLWLLLGLAVLAPDMALAQTYPSRPIKIVVPNPPGGATDTTARLVGARLSEALGQPVVIENRPGSSGTLANEIAAHATPDGYTLLLAQDSQIVINPHLYSNLSVDPLKELMPIASLVVTELTLVVNPKQPMKTFQEFIAAAKQANPKLAYASIGNGSPHHLAMEMLKMRAGIDLVHVPYKGGGPATAALLGNEVPTMFGGNSVSAQVRDGSLRGLAVAGPKRTADFPNLPTIAEFYPGYEMIPWIALFAPSGVPAPVVARLHDEINRALASPALTSKFKAGGLEAFITSPAEFAKFVAADYAKYGALVKAVGAKID